MTYPFLKIGYRNGNVFIRMVGKSSNENIKLTPLEARKILFDLQEAIDRSVSKRKQSVTKMVKT